MRRLRIHTSGIALVAILAACGAGDESTPQDIGSDGVAEFVVSGDGIKRGVPVTKPMGGVQNSTNGNLIFSTHIVQWSGDNLRYSQGFLNPTSGIIQTYRLANATGEIYWDMQGLRYDISRSAPSVMLDELPFKALLAADSVRVRGTNDGDIGIFLSNSESIDLRGGDDTLIFNQDFLAYKFERSVVNLGSIRIWSAGRYIEIRNVEYFEFPSEKISLSTMLLRIGN